MSERYTVVVNMVPQHAPYSDEDFKLAFGYMSDKKQTVTYSADDAINLVSSRYAGPESRINVWDNELMDVDVLDKLKASGASLKWFHFDDGFPSMLDIVTELPSGEGSYTIRSESDVRVATIHHTVSWNDRVSDLTNVAAIARYHVETQKWPGIAYHYVVTPSGQIFKTNDIETVSYHAGSFAAPGDENLYSFGIALGGDFRHHKPTDQQLFAARALVTHHRTNSNQHIAVQGHMHMPGAATQCPGTNLVNALRFIDGHTNVIP